jgi:hypothetical protein
MLTAKLGVTSGNTATDRDGTLRNSFGRYTDASPVAWMANGAGPASATAAW